MLGRWDEVIETRAAFTEEQVDSGGVVLSVLQSGVDVYAHRGQLDEARTLLGLFGRLDESTDLQDRAIYLAAQATVKRAEGKFEEALAAGSATIEMAPVLGPSFQGVKHGVVDALEAAIGLGDSAKAEELFAFVDGLSPWRRPPYLEGHVQRLRARIAGDASGLEAAARHFRDLEAPFPLAVTLLEHAELTGNEESLAEATGLFEQLRAAPWLERASALHGAKVPA